MQHTLEIDPKVLYKSVIIEKRFVPNQSKETVPSYHPLCTIIDVVVPLTFTTGNQGERKEELGSPKRSGPISVFSRREALSCKVFSPSRKKNYLSSTLS